MRNNFKDDINFLLGSKLQITKQCNTKFEAKLNLETSIEQHQESIDLIRKSLENSIDAKKHAEAILNSLVRAVLGELYEVKLEPTLHDKDKTITGLKYVVYEDGRPTNPGRSQGGGLRNILAVGGRLLEFLFMPDDATKVFIIDEPAVNLSQTNLQKLVRWFEDFATGTEYQFIFISQMPVECNHIVLVEKEDNVSNVKVIKNVLLH